MHTYACLPTYKSLAMTATCIVSDHQIHCVVFGSCFFKFYSIFKAEPVTFTSAIEHTLFCTPFDWSQWLPPFHRHGNAAMQMRIAASIWTLGLCVTSSCFSVRGAHSVLRCALLGNFPDFAWPDHKLTRCVRACLHANLLLDHSCSCRMALMHYIHCASSALVRIQRWRL